MLTPRIAALLAAAAALSLSACGDGASNAAPAKPGTAADQGATRDWTQVVVATPEGGLRMGNPDAKVKLLEFASLTCPTCARFHAQGVAPLKSNYIASGRVSYEYRPFILNGVDFAPSLLVRCQATPAAGLSLLAAFYEQQQAWVAPFTKPLTPEVTAKLSALPENQQISAFAANGGLDGFMRSRGMTRAKFDQCTSDAAGIAKLTEIRNDASTRYGLTGTPTFAINGTTIRDAADWKALQPKLDAALS